MGLKGRVMELLRVGDEQKLGAVVSQEPRATPGPSESVLTEYRGQIMSEHMSRRDFVKAAGATAAGVAVATSL